MKYDIEIKNLYKSYKKVHVLKGLNLNVSQGSIVALLGPNGAGKTTTIKILSTLVKPDSGKISVHGYDVQKNSHDVRKSIGLTGQFAAVDEYLSGRENLHLMGRLYRLSWPETIKRSEDLLKQFDLLDAASRPVKTYSGGMLRRLDLAMSLIASPPVIFLDEPTTGLDPRSRLTMWSIIKDLSRQGKTILLTTQQMEEADKLADRIVIIDRGIVISEGTPNELKKQLGNDRIEIVIKNTVDFSKAVSLLPRDSTTDLKQRLIVVSTKDGVTELQSSVKKLSDAGIEVETLSLHKPTLDDVFLSLTGHKTKDGENNV